MSNQEDSTPIFDFSSTETQKQTFRKLLIAMIVTLVGLFALGVFTGLPETLQMAVDLETESVSPWKVTVEALTGLALLALLFWAIYELWNFRSAGLFKLAVAVFAPFFLVQATPSASTPLADYLDGICSVLTGMLLFMGWSFPGILTAPAAQSTPEVPSQVVQPEGAKAE